MLANDMEQNAGGFEDNNKPKKLNFKPEYETYESSARNKFQTQDLSPFNSGSSPDNYNQNNNSQQNNSNYNSGSGRGRRSNEDHGNSRNSLNFNGNFDQSLPKVNKWESYGATDHGESMVNLNLNAQTNFVAVPQGHQT